MDIICPHCTTVNRGLPLVDHNIMCFNCGKGLKPETPQGKTMEDPTKGMELENAENKD